MNILLHYRTLIIIILLNFIFVNIYSGTVEQLEATISFDHPDCVFRTTDTNPIAKISIKNTSTSETIVDYRLDIRNFKFDFENAITGTTFTIPAGISEEISEELPKTSFTPGTYYCLLYAKVNGTEKLLAHYQIAYEPELISVQNYREPDFEQFWINTRAQLDAIDPGYEVEEIEGSGTYRVFKVSMKSFNGNIIRGIYTEPKSGGPFPGIIHVMGYQGLAAAQFNEGTATFSYNTHSMGLSDPVEGIKPGSQLTAGYEDPEHYYYRGGLMDAVRALDFLCSRENVRADRIVANGASQGGFLSIGLAALDKRIAGVAPVVPAWCDDPDGLVIKELAPHYGGQSWAMGDFIGLINGGKISKENLLHNLSYFDGMNMAPSINCPVLLSVGLQDDICPPYTFFAVYNNLPHGKKQYKVYKDTGHGISSEFLFTDFPQWRKNIFFTMDNEPSSVTITKAPEPQHLHEKVYSFYSEKYSPEYSYAENATGTTVISHENIESNQTLKLATFDQYSMSGSFDMSSMEYLHFDVWSSNVEFLRITLKNASKTQTVVLRQLKKEQWNSFDIPLPFFNEINLSTVSMINFSGGGTVYMDNIYCHDDSSLEIVPVLAAVNPVHYSKNVISVYSDVYPDNPVLNHSSEGTGTIYSNVKIASNASIKLSAFDKFSVSFAEELNIAEMDSIHMDIWSCETGSIEINLNNDTRKKNIPLIKNQWKSINIPLQELINESPGQISKITFSGSGTIYMDNIYFYKKNSNEDLTESAPIPPDIDAAKRYSIFSDKYGNISIYRSPSGTNTKIDEIKINDNATLKVTYFEKFSMTRAVVGMPLGSMTHFHLDIWSSTLSTIEIGFGDGTAFGNVIKSYPVPLQNKWNSIEIPLSDFPTVNFSPLITIHIGGGDKSETVYVDNIYFYLSEDEPVEPVILSWTGALDTDWNNSGNWSENSIPKDSTIVYLPGGMSKYPILTTENQYTCKDIYFLHGAELGRQDLLTYKRAHVQLNFGLEASTQFKNNDPENHLAYSAEKSSGVYIRDQWHMFTVPLKQMVSGDFGFGGYPATYLRKFTSGETENGSYIQGKWTDTFKAQNEEIKAGEGFVFWMPSYKDELYYRESIISGSMEAGLKASNGIMEFPYFNKKELSDARRIHAYIPATKKSRFYYVNGDNLNITANYDEINRSEEAYQLAAATNQFDYTLSVDPVKNKFIFIGNPYMSTIDFDKFYAKNNTLIKSYYKTWNGISKTYDDYSVETGGIIGQYIRPMQGFIVELADEVIAGNISLSFPAAEIMKSAGQQPVSRNINKLKNTLRITVQNPAGSGSTVVATREMNEQNIGNNLARKMIMQIHEYPEIYTISEHAEKKALSVNINNTYKGLIPLAIVTSYSGNMILHFEGMADYDGDITFIDMVTGIEIKLTGKDNFSYTFRHTPEQLKGNIIATEDRFFLRMNDKENAVNTTECIVYEKDDRICILSHNDQIKELYIYDLPGNLLYKNTTVNAGFYSIEKKTDFPTLSIIKAVTIKGTKSIKLIIR